MPWTLVGSHIDGGTSGMESGSGVAINGDGTIIASVATANDTIQVYEYSGGSWSTKGANINVGTDTGGAAGEAPFAISMSSDGLRFVVGSRLHDSGGLTNRGKVTMYAFNGTNYAQLGTNGYILGTGNAYTMGRSVAMSGDGNYVIVGADQHDDGLTDETGKVFIYNYDGTTWQLQGLFLGDSAGDNLGRSVAINNDGSVACAGAHLDDSNGSSTGSVFRYERSGSTWTKKSDVLVGGTANDQLGGNLDISADGSILAVQTQGTRGSGGPYTKVYEWDNIGEEWDQIGSSIVSSENNGVALNEAGNVLVVADTNYNSNQGRVQIYKYVASPWTQKGSDITGTPATNFALSVATSQYGDYVVIGAPLDDNGPGTNAGRTFVYYNSDLTPVSNAGSAVVSGSGRFVVISTGTLTVQ